MLGADEMSMSKSETPQQPPEPDGAAPAEVGAPANGAPEQSAEAPAAAVPEPQGSDGAPPATDDAGEETGALPRMRLLSQNRKLIWAAVAALCVAVGAVGSVLGAHAVARTDDANARQAFRQSVSSTGIASTVRVATQHEEDLVVGASTFFAANPSATPGEFSAWARWTDALHRYPELARLGFVALVQAQEPVTTGALASTGPALKSLALRSASTERAPLRAVPATRSVSHCSAVAELVRSTGNGSTVARGHCTLSSQLRSSRDSGRSISSAASSGHETALGIVTPVYRGGAVPSTVAGRRGAFMGWLHEELVPGVVLAQALRGHPDAAVRLRYRSGSANFLFASGAPQAGAQSLATNLHNGWTLRSFGAAAGAGMLADGTALALLIGGCLLSVLLGLIVFLLGSGRARVVNATPAPAAPKVPHEDLYDPLTGLPNRALMLDRAQRMLARAGRQSGLLIGALFIDIDWFKDVSEKIGQSAGDQLLTIVAARLEGVIRAQDSVGSLGGDEFVVLVESAARGARLESLARRVIEALHKPVELDDFGPSFCVTASIGVAFGRYETADDLLRDARLAMYAAKSAGKDRYTLFNANMRSVTESRAVLEAELNRALQEEQFSLLYQPIYDLTTRKVTGVEALVRWQHPTKGLLPPAEFIPLAEETGLIVPIGRWVLEEACSRAAAWHVAGHRIGISVNVSSNQLNRDGFLTDLRRALQQSGIEPSLLTLEIDESTVIRDISGATQRLQELKQLGVRTAIDEFGSGYAYHSDLRRMPLDFLKVDRSSLAATEDEDYRSWLLETILVVARDLSLTVIAKGIDTNEQLTSLQAMGCSMAQGFFLGMPAPVEAVVSLFGVEFSPPAPDPQPPSAPAGLPPAIAEPGTATTGTQVQVLRSTYEPPAGQS
jgi:diguanylate cyclase (GGDEF)-like protein